MISIRQLADDLHHLLRCDDFRDGCPNGIQVEGGPEVHRLATACTASQAAIAAAVEQKADALLVHHGILWGKDPLPIRGMLKGRVAPLLAADCSLLAYHLPLDAHPVHGNNARLLELLGGSDFQPFGNYHGQTIGLYVDTAPCSIDDLKRRLHEVVGHEVLHCPGKGDQVQRIGAVTGGGQSLLLGAAASGCNVLITGEASEQTWHEAAESGCHCLAAGHHATENIAVHMLGKWLAEEHDLQHLRIDIDNPV